MYYSYCTSEEMVTQELSSSPKVTSQPGRSNWNWDSGLILKSKPFHMDTNFQAPMMDQSLYRLFYPLFI